MYLSFRQRTYLIICIYLETLKHSTSDTDYKYSTPFSSLMQTLRLKL